MPEIDSSDPFSSLDNLRMPESMLQKYRQPVKRDGATLHSKSQPEKFRFFQFPTGVFYGVLKFKNLTAVIILAVLYEEWWKNFCRNPVKLSSRRLKAFGISRYQKLRALKILEQSGPLYR